MKSLIQNLVLCSALITLTQTPVYAASPVKESQETKKIRLAIANSVEVKAITDAYKSKGNAKCSNTEIISKKEWKEGSVITARKSCTFQIYDKEINSTVESTKVLTILGETSGNEFFIGSIDISVVD